MHLTVIASMTVALLLAPCARAVAQSPAQSSAQSSTQSSTQSSANAPTRAIDRLSGAIVLDGRVDEGAWQRIAPLPLAQFQPDPGGAMLDRSEIRLAYDAHYLYASGRFWDADADGVRANSLLRDHYAQDDILNLVIDGFHDRENAVWFIVTPAGTRIDGAISNNAEGAESRWNHPAYDMAWEAASVRTTEGWSTEVRIPLATLRFEAPHGRATMGVIAARVISRRKERHIFPAIRPSVAAAQFKPSLAATMTLDVPDAPRLFSVTPYLLGGEQTRPLDPTTPTGEPRHRTTRELGADLKLGLSSRFTLDLTANTDFAQTEVDDQRINLTRFSLFFPERRQFFLERAGLFDVAIGGDDRLFHSRRIGLGGDGQPTRVYGGGRLVGRAGLWDVGALDLLVDDPAGGVTRNAAVVRLRRNVLNAFSHIGAIGTMATGVASGSEGMTGLDGSLRVGPADFVLWSAATTWGGVRAPSAPSLDGSSLRAAWEHRQRSGWSGSGELRYVGARHAPALGFIARTGISTASWSASHGWVGVRGATQERQLGVSGTLIRANTTGEIESAAAGPSLGITFIGSADVQLFARARREVLADTFRLRDDAVVPPAPYDWAEIGLTFGTAPGRRARLRGGLEGGRFYDGTRVTVSMRPEWNVSRHLEISGDLELNRVHFPSRDQRFRGDLARVRSRIAINNRLSFAGALQYNRAGGLLTAGARLRYAFVEGTDLFIVFNEERVQSERDLLRFPRERVSSYVAAKYRFTFR